MATQSPVVWQCDQLLNTLLTRPQKELIERAAYIQGRTVSEFIATALQATAKKVIDETAVWNLSHERQKVFTEALLFHNGGKAEAHRVQLNQVAHLCYGSR